MEIRIVSKSTMSSVGTGADFFSLAKASFMFDEDKASTNLIAYVTLTGEGQTIMNGDLAGGTSTATQNIAPAYFPVATFGSECGAIVDNLAWADSNLNKGYEWILLNGGASPNYFVSGVLNSSQTLSNDPFGTAGTAIGFKTGACWSSSYQAGVNPFV